jgi:hypothetical protein
MVRLRCYDPTGNETGGIYEWYASLGAHFQAQVDSVLELVQAERDIDASEDLKSLSGACEGLVEVLIDFLDSATEIHIRILGCACSRSELVLLTGFQKFNDNAIYGYYCQQADQRKEGVLRDGRRARPCVFPQVPRID